MSDATRNQHSTGVSASASASSLSINSPGIQVITYRGSRPFSNDGNRLLNAVHCTTVHQMRSIIENSPHHHNILVCSAEHLGELKQLLANESVRQIFVYGNYTEHSDLKAKMKVHKKEEEIYWLLFPVAMSYYDEQRHQYKQAESNSLANQQTQIIEELLTQLKAELSKCPGAKN